MAASADIDEAAARLERLTAATAISRRFLAERPMRRGVLAGVEGVFLTVRLTSYRSLPLSCIEGVSLAIDGVEVDPAGLRLVVDDVSYALAELAPLTERWWFILDFARLFVPVAALAAGAHEVAATLVTVEPYMTAGRFSTFSTDRRSLMLEDVR